MVFDLIENHKLKGLKYRELINMLGEPSGSDDSTEIFYDIRINYGLDIDPTNGLTLAFQYNRDSIITDFQLNEWSH